jgi:hypothetical protein
MGYLDLVLNLIVSGQGRQRGSRNVERFHDDYSHLRGRGTEV